MMYSAAILTYLLLWFLLVLRHRQTTRLAGPTWASGCPVRPTVQVHAQPIPILYPPLIQTHSFPLHTYRSSSTPGWIGFLDGQDGRTRPPGYGQAPTSNVWSGF